MRAVLAAAGLLLLSGSAFAGILSTVGPTYPIAEKDALTFIEERLKAKEASGELAEIQKQAIARSMESIENPPPLKGITTVQERKSRLFDPTVVLARTVTDPQGRILVAAGTRINPLDYTPLSKRLLFIDGRDPVQVKAARGIVERDGFKVKPILVAGSWLKTMRSWKVQVYYDQAGRMTQRFAITRVPAIVRQDGKRLLIEEVPPKDLK